MSGWVLVVEQARTSMISAMLAEESFKAVSVLPILESLELARQERPDVILVDCALPHAAMIDFCRLVKQDRVLAKTPIIAVTADSDCRREVLLAGADDFLTPPFDSAALPTRLRVLMRFKQTIDAATLREVPTHDAPVAAPRILIVEDDELSRARLASYLHAASWRVEAVESAAYCLSAARSGDFDVILISLDLGRAAAFDLVTRLRSTAETRLLPILLLFDDADRPGLARGLDLGADDYITRPIVPEELLVRVRLQIHRKQVRDRLRDFLTGVHRPLTDRLTGVYSGVFLAAHIERLSLPDAPRQELSALMLAIDGYADLTRTHGQASTDKMLVELGRRLLSSVRPFDLVARYDQAIFVVLMPQTAGGIAFQIAERLRRGLVMRLGDEASAPDVTISIGVAQRDALWRDPADLLRRAGKAMAAATEKGGNQVAAGPAT